MGFKHSPLLHWHAKAIRAPPQLLGPVACERPSSNQKITRTATGPRPASESRAGDGGSKSVMGEAMSTGQVVVCEMSVQVSIQAHEVLVLGLGVDERAG